MCDGVEDATTRRMDSGALVCLPKHPPKAPMVKRKGRSSCCLRKSLLLVVKRDTAREDVLMRAKYVSGNLERTGRERDVFVLWVIWERLCTSAAAYEIWERPVHLLTFEPTVAINTTRVENVVVDTESCSIPFLLLCLSFFFFQDIAGALLARPGPLTQPDSSLSPTTPYATPCSPCERTT